MAIIDPEQERKRLLDYYSRQMDGRLEQIATQAAGLSELAREVLKEELARRGLNIELLQATAKNVSTPAPIEPPPDPQPIAEEEALSGEFENRDLVTIRRFRDLPDAYLAQGVIESAGIGSFLADDNMVRLQWWWSNLLGGVKLRVDVAEEGAAREILSQPIPESFDVDGIGNYQQPHCPNCQSMDISFEELNKPIAYASLYLFFPIPIHSKGWTCHSCRHTWQEDNTADAAKPI